MWKRISTVLALVLLCGCLKTKDEITLNADGSGKVHLETRSGIPPEMADNMTGSGRSGGRWTEYPPTSVEEAHTFFPEKDFNVTAGQETADNGDVTTIIDAEFKDINALLASPYGRAHQLSARIENGALVVKGITGLEGVARYADMKDEDTMGAMSGMADLQKRKNEMSAEFRITLPNAINSGNGTNAGKTEVWAVQRAQCKDGEEFAQKLGTVCEARCPADGLKFTPVVPVRLALQRFAELSVGAVQGNGSGIDTNKISAAVKFVPYGLSVTRSLDLSGEGGSQENQARLIGAIVVPAEFVPQKWGDAKLDEVVDGKGNDLKPGNSQEDRFQSMRFSSGVDAEENGEDTSTNGPSTQRHVVFLSFRPPDWKVNEIARIKGSATLQYFGGLQTVVKLTNAIPANWIMDMAKMMSGGGFNQSEKNLKSQALSDLGLSMSVPMCMSQSGMTMVTLQVTGGNAALTDVQVFDADGKPWPTMLTQRDMGDRGTCQVVVAGKPQPPLSIALLAAGGGSNVEVPILVEHVAITQN